MSEIKRVKIQNFIETQIPEFLNVDNPLFKEFLEQYYASLEHQTGTIDLANNLLDYKNIENFNNETFYTQIIPCTITSDLQFFDSTINVNHTIGFPEKYGLLKIDNEIITYTSKTDTSFDGCVRGFSGIDKINTKNFYGDFNFISTSAESHTNNSIVENLNIKFFSELFNKFKYQFLPGFENRTFIPEINLQTILGRAKDFYITKGTDTSYKLLFKVLFGEDIEIIKPQDYMLRPSDNNYFITKNILVEKVLGDLDPLSLKGQTLYQNTENGLASAAIYNVEIRPISNNKFLYEISLDPESFILNFKTTKKTNIMEDANLNSTSIIVDSTIGFPNSGELLINSINAPSPFIISYQEKTSNQFLGVSGSLVDYSTNDVVIENDFAYCNIEDQIAYFRVINVIKDLDYSTTSGLRIGDKIKLSSFGLDLNSRPEFNSWIYNIPTQHKIYSIIETNEQNTWRLTLLDNIKFIKNEKLLLSNPENIDDIKYTGTVKRIIDDFTIELVSGDNLTDKTILQKIITKSNVLNYPEANNLISNIQNTYIDNTEKNFYITSSGLPDYKVIANDRKIIVSSPQDPDPTSGVGNTTILNTNIEHKFYTGEEIYFTSTSNLGISTGTYFVSAVGNYSNSTQISLSYSNSDLFSKKYINVSYGGTGEFVKLDYEYKTLEHQKLLRKFAFDKNSSKIDSIEDRTTNNRPVGMLLNGVELYSSTLYDENIYYGKISSIDVVSGGKDYDVVNSPEVQITDETGFGAKAHLNISGSVKGIKIINPGFGYTRDFNVSIIGGNGSGASLKPNIIKTRTNSGFRGDGSGINPTDNSIRFVFPHNFDDGEQIEYISNGNREIEYSDPVTGEIRKIPSNSFYFAGVFSSTIIKLYRTKEDAANKVNEINLTTSPSFGFHYFRSLNSRLTLVDISVENSGSGYSNKKILVPSVSDNLGKQNGIDIYNNVIFAEHHNFRNKDLVVYSTTDTPISGLSTTSKYYISVIDENRFKLSLAGIGNTISDENFNNNKFVRLNSVGVGTHTFAYPPIEIVIESNPEKSNGRLDLPILEPIITGSIESIFVENSGQKYGVPNIINYHRRPNIFINEISSEALLRPVIIDGVIVDVQILSYGNGYGKDVDILVYGSGKFADIHPIIENGKIISLSILNGGINYKESDTFIVARPRGSGAKFLANIFEWKINQVEKNKFLLNNDDEGILVPSKNQQSGLQFIHFYPPKVLRNRLDDNITNDNIEETNVFTSPILGWSYDGYPIYGPYTNIDNIISRVRTSYVKSIERNSNFRPTGIDFPDGFFIQDYVFDKENGDLDEYNGRFIRNSDFPDGTYAYFFTIDIDSNKNSVPQYPYVIAKEFKNIPNWETYDPNYNQDLNLNNLGIVRNTSPYYLNSQNSSYGLIDTVDEKYKQEFIVNTISKSGIDSISIYQPGSGYKVGDIIDFDNTNTGGSGIYASISKIKGKNIDSLSVGVSTFYPITFVKNKNIVTGIANTYHNFSDGDTIIIKNVSSPLYKYIEGPKTIQVPSKVVGLTTDILNLGSTGTITKIFTNDISGFSVDDYIKIDYEILRILNIIPTQSSLRVERISNTGIHTAGLSLVELLPKEFSFTDIPNSLVSIKNKIVYFNPEEVVGFGLTYTLENNDVITIPEKTIYIPKHSFYTGQPLSYYPGLESINLTVYDYPGGPNFQLSTGQTVYAINYGVDFLGISTVGYSTSVGIGTTELKSLYFSSSVAGVGVAHSLRTQYEEIVGEVENYSVDIISQEKHGLINDDLVSLSFTPEFTKTIKFRYDSFIRKITTELEYFDSSLVDTENSTIEINSDNLNTGDKIVYYNEGNSSIGGLVHNQTYFVIKDTPNKIKLADYYYDAVNSNYIELTAVSTGNHSIAKINPKLNITKGSYVEFDLSDDTLSNLTLRLYKDSNFNIELEEYNYISNGQRYLRTSLNTYPREIYYSFCSSVNPVCPDTEVMNNNLIELVESYYLNEYNVKVVDDNSFKIILPQEPETTLYNNSNLTNLYYSTLSKSATGPIEKIKLNFGGKNYSRLPKLSRIISENGTNASLKAKSNKIGRISSLERVKDGFDYPTDETLLPLMSVPAILQVEGISRIDNIGIVTGGRNYNTSPTLKVIGNDGIVLQSTVQGSSVVDVKILENVSNLSQPLRIVPVRNSNGYSIDDITVANNLVTLELLNSDNQLYPLINTGYGTSEFKFPFEVGDEIFIERCRVVFDEFDGNGQPIPKDNYNSSNYDYRFFTVTGINTTNYTVTYSMEGISDNLGTYTSDLGYGYVVNRKDMAEFEMNIINDLSYMSREVVLGYDENNTNTFSARVMENGWDNDLNQLRLTDVKGVLKNGDRLKGQSSLLDGVVTDVNIFNLKSTLDVSRDKVNNLGDRVGFLNDFQQRISDNNYYQKFSYSIKGKIPYTTWREPVKSTVHPSGFKEFSDLDVVSISTSRIRVGTAASLDLTVNIDNFKSLYTKNNFAMVTEEEPFEDGSIERIVFEEGVALKPYILAKTNKVIVIDDISSQFNGTTNLEIIANKPVTFISTDLYRLGVNTEGLNVGDKIGYSTYHFYPDSTYILSIGSNYVGISSDTPHRVYPINGISTSITQDLNFYRRIPGDKIVGISSFKLTNNNTPLVYREFDASNGISTVVDLETNSFTIPNHNLQTGQKINYTPKYNSIIAIANTTVGSGAVLEPIFVGTGYSVSKINVIDGGSGYNSINKPTIEIIGTKTPLISGIFNPLINSGIITSIQILDPGYGYFPDALGEVGISTTNESEGRKDIIMGVGGGIGSAIYERGYNVAISTTVSGISSNVIPNFSGQQNVFWGFNDPYIPIKSTSGSGIDAKFSVFIVYNSTTGQPISTSVLLRDGGRGYSVGDTISIAGTFMGGETPTNDLSFVVSKVSSTRLSGEANESYTNIPGNSIVGFGSGAIFNIQRDDLGDISNVDVVFGGSNYELTDNISIAGTYIGGSTPLDNLFISPTILGTDKLPNTLYVEKINNNSFKVAGLSTGGILDLTTLGVGYHSFTIEDPNSSSLITIDNIIQTPIYRKNLQLSLNTNVLYDDNIIYIQSGISSVVINDILQINDEYMSIKKLNVDGENSLLVERAFLGTNKAPHSISDPIYVVAGNYNIVKDVIYFATPPYGPTGIHGFEVNSSFAGRLFSRRYDPYNENDSNLIIDDISNQFTGIAATEFILKSNGEDVVGIFTNTNSITGGSAGVDINNNPIILINNIPQIGGKDYIIDNPSQNTIRFISGVPLAGKITKVGYTTGFGYLPLVGASATVSVSAAGTISNVYLTGYGQGYRTPPIISIASTVGSGASITSTIGTAGTITSLTIVNPGFGYTNTILPEVLVDLPQNYYNLDLEYKSGYSGDGTGARVSVVVGNGSSIIDFNLDDPGISYKVGDVLVAPGVSTNPYASTFEPFEITILETFTDSFAGWYPGQFIQFDDISPFFNGFKRKFTLTVTQFGIKEVVSLKANPEDLSIANNLFIFINDILQVPNVAYTFNGSRITFTEPPKPGSKCNLLFFRGSDLDVEQIDPPKTIKEGDVVQIDQSILDPLDRPQFDRVVKNIVATDILDTFPYDSLGISTDPTKLRPLNWTKQTQDRVINGVLYPKARPSLKSRIIPTASVIKDIQTTDREIYVDSALPLFSDIDENRGFSEDLRDVIIVNNREIEPPIVRSVVSTSSTISEIQIIDAGTGYKNIDTPEVIISSRFITRKDPIYDWNSNVGISATTLNFNSVGYGTGYISVGSSGLAAVSLNGEDWVYSSKINTSYEFTDVIGFGNNYISVGQTAKVYRKVGLSTSDSWTELNLFKATQDFLGRVTIQPSSYSNQFNKIAYNNFLDLLVVVGNAGGLFSSIGITTESLFEKNISFANLNSIAFNSNYTIAVGNIGDIIYTSDGIIWSAIARKTVLQNLNDIIWDGSRFIAVGNNGTILTTTNNPESWTLVSVNNFTNNIIKLNYNNGLYTLLDNFGKLYFSLNLIDWTYREVSNDYINDVIALGSGDSEKWVAVGSTGFISYSNPILNPAVAISTVVNESLDSITIINGGFGYSNDIYTPIIVETDTVEKEQIYSIKAKGDFGTITNIVVYETGNIGFGTTSPAIEFTLKSENYNSPILQNMEYTPLSIGDYFVINNSNVVCGHALTGITTSLGGMSNYPTSKVGTTTSFIDGIYRVENSTEPSLGISTIRCNFVPIPAVGADIIQVNIGINTVGFYGRYSFGVIYDYQNRARENPRSFIVNKDDGLVGLDTGPVLYRTRGLI